MRAFKFFKSARRGFTLLEVLVVVVIAVLVTMFAVPSYRKAQDRNRFMAASGVLMDLGNAMRMFREDYRSMSLGAVSVTTNPAGTCPTTPSASNLVLFLQCHKYLNNMPLRSSTYKGYRYVISSSGNASCSSNCPGSNIAVACMYGSNTIAEYQCAWIDFGGVMHTTNG